MEFSHTATTILEKRYLMKDEEGRVIESPDEMFHRVANFVAKDEASAHSYYNIMSRLEFLPNSPTLMNAGHPHGGCLSACFVVPIEDNMESILDGVKHAALICKAGGGVGYSFGKLRPKNDIVSSTAGVASGPISFMQIYDSMTDVIKQGGRRRGANMGILPVHHPDIEEFIACKQNTTKLTNFNISVAIDTNFMNCVIDDSSYALLHPRSGKVARQVRAKDIWNTIVEQAWLTGEPGLIFIDAINQKNPTPHLGNIEATNPCGEQPLLPYESCNLGSINLSKFINEDGEVDNEALRYVVYVAVRFLDDVIDANSYPLPEIKKATEHTRKIGLGVMGWADMLIKLGIPYGSKESIVLAEDMMYYIQNAAHNASLELAQERGVAPCYVNINQPMPRNATTTTIAPTGSISIIAGCSSGIEPLIKLAYTRTILDGTTFNEVHELTEEILNRNFGSDHRTKARKLLSKQLYEIGSFSDELRAQYPEIKHILTAHQIPPEHHLKMQAAFQKYTDNAVSKTINLPETATKGVVSKIFTEAWRLGIKGITVYRDGARAGQVLSSLEPTLDRAERPLTITGSTTETKTGCGSMYVTHNYVGDKLFEVFLTLGKAGGCEGAQAESTGRLISLALRSGVPIETIIKQLSGIRCPNPCWHNGAQILSCHDAIAKVLSQQAGVISPDVKGNKAIICPECNSPMEVQSNCEVCSNCGFSKCR